MRNFVYAEPANEHRRIDEKQKELWGGDMQRVMGPWSGIIMVTGALVSGCMEDLGEPGTLWRHYDGGNTSTNGSDATGCVCPECPPCSQGEDAGTDVLDASEPDVVELDASVPDVNQEDVDAEIDADAGTGPEVSLFDVHLVDVYLPDVTVIEDSGIGPEVSLIDVHLVDVHLADITIMDTAPDIQEEDAQTTCLPFPVGKYGTPLTVTVSVSPGVTGNVTSGITAGIFPAVGSVPSNSWIDNNASFTLTMDSDSGNYYPGVIAVTARNSLELQMGDYHTDVYGIDTGKLADHIGSVNCDPNDSGCEEWKMDSANPDPDTMTYLFNLRTLEVLANVTKCSFALPGGQNCTQNTDHSLFQSTAYNGSFSSEFPSENRTYVALIHCPWVVILP